MIFSVVYSVDCASDDDINSYIPPNIDLWQQTEGDDQRELDYLGGVWKNGFHRKWIAILNRQQFDEFVDNLALSAEDVETMGTLGAIGIDGTWAPAISFTREDPDAVLSAYVTPIPEIKRHVLNQFDWDRIRQATIAVYG